MAIGAWRIVGNMVGNVGGSATGPHAASVFQHFSTTHVQLDARFDYWRSLFDASRIERADDSARGVRRRMMAGPALHDILFAALHGDAITSHFGERGSGIVLLGFIAAGKVDIRHGRDDLVSVRPGGGLVLFDCDRPFVTRSGPYAMNYLALPRELVTTLLAADPVDGNAAVRMLPPHALTRSLYRHLADMACSGMGWSGHDADRAMATARALAVTVLAGIGAHWRGLPDTFDEDILAAARYQLRQRAGDPRFTATELSATLGCSRAHLYRLFERRGETITGQLRGIRLRHARRLLETMPEEPVGMVALRCGYTDMTAFGKAFRRRFGMSPSECRWQAGGNRAAHM